MAAIKTNEAIELLLHLKSSLKSFLFDFSEPYKIDLEKFISCHDALQRTKYGAATER